MQRPERGTSCSGGRREMGTRFGVVGLFVRKFAPWDRVKRRHKKLTLAACHVQVLSRSLRADGGRVSPKREEGEKYSLFFHSPSEVASHSRYGVVRQLKDAFDRIACFVDNFVRARWRILLYIHSWRRQAAASTEVTHGEPPGES